MAYRTFKAYGRQCECCGCTLDPGEGRFCEDCLEEMKVEAEEHRREDDGHRISGREAVYV